MAEEEGYTLVELMVALVVTLVLGALLASIYVAVTRHVVVWQRAVALENEAHLMVQRLGADLFAAKRFAFEAERRTWMLADADGRTVRYRHRDGRLDRNGCRMHDASLAVIDFRLTALQDEAHDPPLIGLHLSVKNRERTLTFATAVTLRQPRPWRPLPAFGDSTRAR